MDLQIIEAALLKWGKEKQIEMVIEECTELSLALQKLRRAKPSTVNEVTFNVIDEIADVIIMIEQCKQMFDIETIEQRIEFKLSRLKNRLEKSEY